MSNLRRRGIANASTIAHPNGAEYGPKVKPEAALVFAPPQMFMAAAGGAPAPVMIAAPAAAAAAAAPRFVLYKHSRHHTRAGLGEYVTAHVDKYEYESEKQMRDDVLHEKRIKKELRKAMENASRYNGGAERWSIQLQLERLPYKYTLDRAGRIPFNCEEEGCCGSSCTIAGGRKSRRRGSRKMSAARKSRHTRHR